MALIAPILLDPAQMTDSGGLTISTLIYSGLLKLSPRLELLGDLAEQWETSSDGKTITFILKKDIRFHNGAPITAEDVVRSLTRLVSKDSKVFDLYSWILGADDYHTGKERNVKGLVLVSECKLKVVLRNPYPPFLSILAGGTAKVLPEISEGFFKKPIGSGPFVLDRPPFGARAQISAAKRDLLAIRKFMAKTRYPGWIEKWR